MQLKDWIEQFIISNRAEIETIIKLCLMLVIRELELIELKKKGKIKQ